MVQLIKQVLLSFKKSVLLIFSLAFICLCIITTTFSLLYLNTNTQNSINNLNTYGNSANLNVEQSYELEKPQYIVDKYAIAIPTKKLVPISNLKYVNGQKNVIFPYSTSDFSNPNVNTRPWERKFGIMKSIGAGLVNGVYQPNQIGTTFSSWYGLGWSMNDQDGKQVFNPSNIIYEMDSQNNVKMIGYFNENTGQVDDSFVLYEGHYSPSKKDFNSTDTNNAIPSTSPLHILYSNIYRKVETSKLDYNLVKVSLLSDLYNLLLTNVNKGSAQNFYSIKLDTEKLSKLQKSILNDLNETERNKILYKQILIKDEWVDNYLKTNPSLSKEKVIEQWLITLADQESDKLLNFFQEKAILYSQHFLDINGIQSQEESSFSITDSESTFEYLVSRKENNKINNIVYDEGSRLEDSNSYLSFANRYNEVYTSTDNKKYLKNLLILMLSSTPTTGEEILPYIKLKIKSILESIERGEAVDIGDYNEIFAIYEPEINKDIFYKTDKQKIDLNFIFQGSISPTGLVSSNILSVYTPYGFSTVVPSVFLKANNKEYLPESEWNNLIARWNDMLNSWKNFNLVIDDNQTLNNLETFSKDFKKWISNLDSKYTITVNTMKFVIIGTGLSPEMAYPSTSIESLIINPKNQMLIYANLQGYESILSTNSGLFQNKYFASRIKPSSTLFGTKVFDKKLVAELNNFYKENFNSKATNNLVYLNHNFESSQSILSFRIYLPKSITLYVSTVAVVVIIVLIIIGLYLSYLLLKTYINKNIVQLSIIKANGFSTFKICSALSLFGLFVSIISGSVGYVLAWYLQGVFYSAISPFWYITVKFLKFSLLGFVGGSFIIFVTFFIFTYFIISYTFKTPINELISRNVETKATRILNLLKNNVIKVNPLLKFRLSLSFSNFSRFVFYTLLCSFGLALVTVGFSLPNKFNESIYMTELNKQYKYDFKFVTPTEQSGLYKYQKYSDLGFTDLDKGIYPLYPGKITWNQRTIDYAPITNYPSPYQLESLKVLDPVTGKQKQENGNNLYYGNLLLPSYVAKLSLEKDPFFGKNAVFAKWLLDINIEELGIKLNPWEIVKSSLPSEIVSRAETQNQNFLKHIYDFASDPKNAKIYELQKKNNFIIYNNSNNSYEIDSKKVVMISGDVNKIRFNDNFLTFIGYVYGSEELSNSDVKISYGIIPYEDNETEETYTYVEVDALARGKRFTTKITGIKQNSKFINLKDNSGNDISHSLIDKRYENPVVINNGAAYKYKLKVGSKINVTINNSYFRYSRKLLDNAGIKYNDSNAENIGNKQYTLTVSGISSDSVGEELYIDQDLANMMVGMTINAKEITNGGSIISNIRFDNNNNVYPIRVPTETINKINYKPFNGIFSNKKVPIFLDRNISFYSTIGIWPNITVLDSNSFSQFWSEQYKNGGNGADANYGNSFPNLIYEILTTNNKQIVSLEDRGKLINYLKNNFNDFAIFGNFIINNFGQNPIAIAIGDVSSFLSQIEIYSSLFTTISIIQGIGLSIFVPLIVIMILVMTSIMMNEFKNMIAVLKTLGYSDKENLLSIVITYLPVLFLALVIGFVILFVSVLTIQFTLYNVSSIFISSTINLIPYLYGVSGILSIMIINFLFTIFLLKKMNLKKSIAQ